MRSKHWLILAGGLAILAAVVVVFDSTTKEGGANRPERIDVGQILDADKIRIKGVTATTEIKKTAQNSWILTPDEYPADPQKIVKLFDQLERAKVLDHLAATHAAETGVEGGTELAFLRGEDTLLTLRVGKNRDKGGQYWGVGDGDLWLVNEALSVSSDEGQWELKSLLAIEEGGIAQIALLPAAGKGSAGKEQPVLAFDSEAKKWAMTGWKGEPWTESQFAALDRSLRTLNYSTRLHRDHPDAAALGADVETLQVKLTDGSTFSLQIGEIGAENKKVFVRLSQVQLAEAGTSLAKSLPAIAGKADQWIYQVSDQLGDQLRFREAKPKKGS